MFRYEDAANDPLDTVKKLYEFVGLDMAQSVHDWIVNNTFLQRYVVMVF